LWIKGNKAIVKKATMPAQIQQGRLRNDNGDDAIVMSVGSHFKVRKDNISSLVVEYPDREFMR
jgi:hypothetical protein